jgi:hypothetical protein
MWGQGKARPPGTYMVSPTSERKFPSLAPTQEADRRRLVIEAASKLVNEKRTSILAPLGKVRAADQKGQ